MRSTSMKLILALTIMAFAGAAHAQATRTWVSGVGDDANPCSRTAPCKTFAGAISKTATGGEINALDDGGFGTVTITKPITIEGGGHIASVLNSGTTGVIINTPGANDLVILRNIEINGAGTGLRGINVISCKRLVVENVHIYNQSAASPNGQGIFIGGTTTTQLVSIRHCQIDKNSTQGVMSSPSSLGVNGVDISDSTIEHNAASGIELTGTGSKLILSRSFVNYNGGSGVALDNASADAHIASSFLNFNVIGVSTTNGVAQLFANQISHNQISVSVSGGSVQTHGNNAIMNNVTNTLPTATSPAGTQ
jgi:hypothetical protein